MAIQPIRLFGDPVLRTPAAPVTTFDHALERLIADLTDTMLDVPGSGLAAPQIGVGLRVFTYNVDDQVGYLINPEVDVVGEERQTDVEGCLSIPDVAFACERAMNVIARGVDKDGAPVELSASGWLARTFQHETDHLDGILFIDRLDRQARKEAMRMIRSAQWTAPTERAPGALTAATPRSVFSTRGSGSQAV